jgi:hypothetical protein
MTASGIEGPDFVCIGMQKAGTGWLFDQVQYHPDFWMPPVKELNYLLENPSRLRNVQQRLRVLREPGKKNRARDGRDVSFLEEAIALKGEPRSLANYASLFHHKDGLLSGDITPAYSELDGDVIAELAQFLPNTKVVLIVRDPVSRACSHISEFHRDGKFDARTLDEPDALREFLESSEKISRRSFPTEIVRRWTQSPSAGQFRYFFFDDISDRPEKARQEILAFIGAAPEKKSGKFEAGYNRKVNFAKLEFSGRAMAVIADFFKDELNACADLFGGYARDWKSKYGA